MTPPNPPRKSLLLALPIGCAALLHGCGIVLHLPEDFRSVPGHDKTLAKWLESARDLSERGEDRAALQAVEQILRDRPDHVNSHRLRQDILRRRGRIGLVLLEAEDRLAASPTRAAAHYLSGRVQSTNAGKRAAFRRAVEIDPREFWGWFGLAFTLRDTDRKAANEIYKYLYGKASNDLRTAVAYAASLWRAGRNKDAFRVYRKIRERHPGVSALGMTETLIRSGNRKEAWRHLLTALLRRPYDPGVRGAIASLLARGLPADGIQELLDVLRRDPEQMALFAGDGASLLAAMFQGVGDPAAALAVLRGASPLAPNDRRLFRKLMIVTGDVAGFLLDLEEGVVEELIEDEGNQVRGRWRALFQGRWMQATDPLADVAVATTLVRALVDVGYLEFADSVATIGLLRHAEANAALIGLRDEIRRERAFESGLRRILTRGYQKFSHENARGSLTRTFKELRDLSKRVLGKDVVGQPKLFTLPFVGTLVDSLGPGLTAHLAGYNKHLVMGQRSGRPVEGMILTRLSMRHVDPVPGAPMPPRCIEVVGEHRQLEPLDQADLAGIALLNHYVIDMDEVRSWAGTIALRRRIARADGGVVLRDGLPRRAAALEPAGVEWRLALLSTVADADLDAAVLDIIRWHERGHMADFLHFLPVTLHPWRSLALVLRNGLSALGISSEMEGRAELTALAMSRHTRLVLAHITGFLDSEAGDSPHAHGFRMLAEEVFLELRRRGVAEPEVRSWHRVDPHTLRQIGRKLLKRLW